jgi:hypothetical protein
VEAIRRQAGVSEAGKRQIEVLLDEWDVARWVRLPAAILCCSCGNGDGPRYRKAGQRVRCAPAGVRSWLNWCPTEGAAEEASRA